MSLINRMLDDLAARQAPGAETLDGLRLSAPLAQARTALMARRLLVLVLALLAGLALVWFLRAGRPDPAGAAPQAASLPKVMVAPAGLRLDSRLSLPAPTAPTPTAAAAATAPVQAARQDPARLASDPGTVPRLPRLALDEHVVTPISRPARNTSRPARPAPAAQESSDEPALPAEAAPAAAGSGTIEAASPESRRQAVRDALAQGEPGAALLALGPAASHDDAELLALRAAALQRLDRHPEAAAIYRQLTRLATDESAYWVGLAISLERLDQPQEARNAYLRALAQGGLASSLRGFAQQRASALKELP